MWTQAKRMGSELFFKSRVCLQCSLANLSRTLCEVSRPTVSTNLNYFQLSLILDLKIATSFYQGIFRPCVSLKVLISCAAETMQLYAKRFRHYFRLFRTIQMFFLDTNSCPRQTVRFRDADAFNSCLLI